MAKYNRPACVDPVTGKPHGFRVHQDKDGKVYSHCVRHLPEDELNEAEAKAGKYLRCKQYVRSELNPRRGERCAMAPIRGGEVCTAHGGQLPQVRRHATENAIKKEAEVELNKLTRSGVIDLKGVTVDNPLELLMELAGEAKAWKDVLAERVEHLKTEDWRYNAGRAGEQIRGEVVLYERSIERLAKILTAMARLNISERLAAVTERQAELVEQAITRALIEAGVDEDLRYETLKIVARKLRYVS